MTITKEERAEIRSVISDAQHKGKDIVTLPLDCIIPMLDALESAEARAEVLMLENEELSDLVEEYQDGKLEMKSRAEAAEREREMLIDRIMVLDCPRGEVDCPSRKPGACDKCWIEWARQQARGGGNEHYGAHP